MNTIPSQDGSVLMICVCMCVQAGKASLPHPQMAVRGVTTALQRSS